MKLVDENGKIFGKVNIVDLIVLVLIVAIAAAGIIRVSSKKLNADNSEAGADGEQYCYVTLLSSLVVPEVAEGLKEGDKLVANNAFTDAEVVSVDVAPAAYVGTNSEGKAVYSEHPLWKDVKEKVNPKSVILKVGNQEVRVGYSYILKTQTVETNCKIRGIEFKDE